MWNLVVALVVEGCLAHCWALRNQASLIVGWIVRFVFVGVSGFFWCLPLPVHGVCCVWGLVGLLFEICIVDASIF